MRVTRFLIQNGKRVQSYHDFVFPHDRLCLRERIHALQATHQALSPFLDTVLLYLSLGSKGAIYVWGANVDTITKALVEKLYKTYGSLKYNKAYYNNKLKEGAGKIGADCSGSLYPVSGYDATASAYYNKCTEKGDISQIPKNKVCLVFKKNLSGTINHVGCYTGDGYVSEMASSQKNYQRKPLSGNGWDLWGMPDFITDPNTVMKEEVKYKMKTLKKGSKGNQVTIFETLMKEAGYYNGEIDDNFGNGCVNACNAFQKDYPECGTNGKPDSSWGKKCWNKLFSLFGA